MVSINEKLLSVVVPVYNAEAYLSRCIESILNQTWRNLELILVDDGSDDGSGEICRCYGERDGRIRLVRQENQGVAAARKSGTMEAKGQYLTFVDADDYLDADLYEQLLPHMESAELVTSGYYKEGRRFFDNIAPGAYETKENMEYLYGNMIYLQNKNIRGLTSYVWNKLFLTRIAVDVFKETSDQVFVGEDSEFLYRYVLKCRTCHITKICGYHYETNESSIIHSINFNFLNSVTALYLSLEKDFRKSPYSHVLMPQLAKWILSLTDSTFEFFGFEKPKKVKRLGYINPFINRLEGKKVILYGAGLIGRNYLELYKKTQEAEVVLWADKAFEIYRNQGLEVCPPDQIGETEHDFIIIAVKKQETAMEIKRELLSMGLREETIKWQPPITTEL